MGKILEYKTYKKFRKAERKTPWEYLIQRDQSILLDSMMMRGYSAKKYYKELFGIDYSWRSIKHINSYVFYNPEDVRRVQTIGENVKLSQIKKDIAQSYKLGNEILRYSEKINKSDLPRITNSQLMAILDGYQKKIKKFSVFVIYPMYAYGEPFGEKIAKYLAAKGVKNMDEVLSILTFPKKKNFSYYEQYKFLSLANEISKNKELRLLFAKQEGVEKSLDNYPEILRRIKNHINEFGWIQCRNYYGKEWSLKEMIKRIKSVLSQAGKELGRLKGLEEKMIADYARVREAFEIKGEIKKTIELSKELVYYRTYRTDVLHKSGFNIRPLLIEIGKRFEYDFSDMIHMRIEEILKLSQKKVSKEVINERKRDFALVLIDGKINWFWGGDFKKYRHELAVFKKSQKKEVEIKGNTANGGKITGRVKIVRTVDDLPKVEKGDILVAPMTFPSFIPAMEKAAAFVINEGGILCHAAIVSREMNKPCVINTKNATEILRDEQLVEVSADKGIVKIIE